jgi:hypothetical protein
MTPVRLDPEAVIPRSVILTGNRQLDRINLARFDAAAAEGAGDSVDVVIASFELHEAHVR